MDNPIEYTKKKKKKKNNNFSIGEVFYAPIIQNNLISIHYLRIKGFNSIFFFFFSKLLKLLKY